MQCAPKSRNSAENSASVKSARHLYFQTLPQERKESAESEQFIQKPAKKKNTPAMPCFSHQAIPLRICTAFLQKQLPQRLKQRHLPQACGLNIRANLSTEFSITDRIKTVYCLPPNTVSSPR